MTRRDESFDAHPVLGLLDQQTRLLGKVEAKVGETEELEEIQGIRRVLQFVRAQLDGADPDLVSSAFLDDLRNKLNPITQELQNYLHNSNRQHLSNAASHVDNVIRSAVMIPAIRSPDDVAGLRESITSFRRSASQLLRSLEDEISKEAESVQGLRQSMSQLQQEIDAQKGRLDTAISQFQQQTSDAAGQSLQQASGAASRFLEQFSAAQERRSSEFEKLLADSREQFQELTQAREEELKALARTLESAGVEQRKQLDERARSTLNQIETLRDQAQQIVHTVGNIGMTGDYQRNAEEQRTSANRWRVAAMILFVLGVTGATLLLGVVAKDDLSLVTTLRRIALAVLILTPAYYAAQQSRVHREREVRYRSIELELASLDPFLALMPDDLRQSIKSELAGRYFAGMDSRVPQLDVDTRLTLLERVRSAIDRTKRPEETE